MDRLLTSTCPATLDMPDMPAIIDQRQHPLADGSALAWASAWGEDAVGPFVDIAFGEVT